MVGDTHGHFYPALAVIEAFRRRPGATEVLLLGPSGPGADLAARHGLVYRHVSSAPLVRVGAARRMMAAGRAVAGFVEAWRALRTFGARLAIGFGAHASGPALLAARSLGLSTVIHEGNVRPGLANRLLARTTDRIHLHHAATGLFFPRDRQRLTGWPVRASVSALSDPSPCLPDARRPARVLVFSGSRGEALLAREVPALLGEIVARGLPLEVHHQGAADVESIEQAYARAGVPARVSPFIDDVAAAYRWADLAITRAGAGTLAELAVSGLPSLLVPLADAAGDHQQDNAAAFADAGAALTIREREWDGKTIASRLLDLLNDPEARAAMSASARRLARPDAADAVVESCEALMEGRW